VNEEVIDLLDEVIDATIVVVSNPREKVVNGFFQRVFEVRSKRYSNSGKLLRNSTHEWVTEWPWVLLRSVGYSKCFMKH